MRTALQREAYGAPMAYADHDLPAELTERHGRLFVALTLNK